MASTRSSTLAADRVPSTCGYVVGWMVAAREQKARSAEEAREVSRAEREDDDPHFATTHTSFPLAASGNTSAARTDASFTIPGSGGPSPATEIP
jgi:hypothetical protein